MKNERIIGCSTPVMYLNREHFARYRACGIGAMELSVDAQFYEILDIPRIAKEAAAEDVMTWSFHLPYYLLRGSDISEFREEERRFAVSFQSEWIKKAADAGFRYTVVHPSREPFAPEEREERKKASAASIAELSVIAKDCGMRLAVEVLPRNCLGNCSGELLWLLKDAPDAGVCFDTNHLLSEDPLDFLNAVGGRLMTLHLSDCDGVDERHWLPGEGILNWTALMNKLDEAGYEGVLMYEVNLNPNPTILREHLLTPEELRQNADELILRQPLTKRGVPQV